MIDYLPRIMKLKNILIIFGLIVVLGIGTIAGLTIYSIRFNYIPTAGLANTIIPGEAIITTKFYGNIKRGDLIVFKLPSDPAVVYIKRVIGLPGEEILCKGTSVFINGQEIPEQKVFVEIPMEPTAALKIIREEAAPPNAKYKVYYDITVEDDHFSHGMKFGVGKPFQIPADSYFMMGDSRDNSLDSRYWGIVPKANLVSKALRIYSSPNPDRMFTNLEIQ